MARYAAQATPWGLVALAGTLLMVLLAALRLDPWTLWPLQGVAVGLLAGAVGWCLDEPAAVVADAAPRGLVWRTTARLGGVALLLASWAAAVWWARSVLFGQAGAVLIQGWAAAALTCAWVTWRRAAGEAVPGQRWALVVIPLSAAWALVRPLEEALPVFPFAATASTWETSRWGWTIVAVVSVAVLVLVLARDVHLPASRGTQRARARLPHP